MAGPGPAQKGRPVLRLALQPRADLAENETGDVRQIEIQRLRQGEPLGMQEFLSGQVRAVVQQDRVGLGEEKAGVEPARRLGRSWSSSTV